MVFYELGLHANRVQVAFLVAMLIVSYTTAFNHDSNAYTQEGTREAPENSGGFIARGRLIANKQRDPVVGATVQLFEIRGLFRTIREVATTNG